jgi:hypothetical protein
MRAPRYSTALRARIRSGSPPIGGDITRRRRPVGQDEVQDARELGVRLASAAPMVSGVEAPARRKMRRTPPPGSGSGQRRRHLSVDD